MKRYAALTGAKSNELSKPLALRKPGVGTIALKSSVGGYVGLEPWQDLSCHADRYAQGCDAEENWILGGPAGNSVLGGRTAGPFREGRSNASRGALLATISEPWRLKTLPLGERSSISLEAGKMFQRTMSAKRVSLAVRFRV